MKILKFKYTKRPEEVSSRVLIPLTSPSKMYFGVDISQFDTEQQEVFTRELAIAINTRDTVLGEKILELGLEHCYRSFLEDKMSETDVSYRGDTCPELTEEKIINLKGSY